MLDVVLLQVNAQELERLLGSVRPVDQVKVLGGNRSGIHQGLEVDDLVPVLPAINHHSDVLGELLGLRQRQQFEHFVEGPEASGKHHQRFGQIGKPQLAHKEVVELEVQVRGDVGIGNLLERQIDIEADSLAACLVGCLLYTSDAAD